MTEEDVTELNKIKNLKVRQARRLVLKKEHMLKEKKYRESIKKEKRDKKNCKRKEKRKK